MRRSSSIVALVFLGIGTAGFVACEEGGGDAELGETPELETTTPTEDSAQPEANAPVLTGQLQPPQDAQAQQAGQQVTGNVMVYRGQRDDGMDAGSMNTDTARAGAAGGQGYSVLVNARGLSEGEHAWHIHSGPCGERAPVVVAMTPTQEMQGLDEPLTPAADGVATNTAYVPGTDVSLDDLQGGEYSLHIHERGGLDHGPTVACADLRRGAATAGGGTMNGAAETTGSI